jgi:sec-independent protein translocase protein TatA
MLSSVLLFFSFSGSEIMLILFVALILFGGDKFPEIARGLGKGIREFKDMSDGVKREIHSQINNYDLDPNRSSTTSNTQLPPPVVEQPYDHVSDYHPDKDIDVPLAPQQQHTEVATTTAAAPAPVSTTDATITHQPVAEKPVVKDFDPNIPPNTMPHQSY